MKSIDKSVFIRVILIGIVFMAILELVLFGFFSFEKESTINDLYPKSNEINTQLDNVFQSSITISDGYLSYITSNLDASKEDTEIFLNHLFTYDRNYVKNIAILEDTTIKYNYPYEGNETSIGVDLSIIDGQSETVLTVKNDLQATFVGPIDLVQGGKAFILRIPILDGETYWGQISVVIDADLFTDTISSSADINDLSIKITDKNTQQIIYTLGEVNQNKSISSNYSNKYLSWNIEVSDNQPPPLIEMNTIRRIIGIIIILTSCIIIYKTTLLNREIKHNSKHDSLSGDYNRAKFIRDYNDGRFTGMLIAFTDVNKFKLINDTLGHSFGDWILIQLSNKFRSLESFRTYRISGDEFILVSSTPMSLSEFKTHFPTNGFSFYNDELKQDLDIAISIGVLEKLSNTVNLESILMYLDYAMYDAKKENKGFTIVDNALMKLYDKTKVIEQQLIEDIKNNRLIPYYQPIINMKEKRIEGFEVLSRWIYNDKIQPAAMFIGVVKKIKYVDLVDINLFNRLQDEYTELSNELEEIKDYSFSVNLSAESLMIFEKKNTMFDNFIKDRVIPFDKVVFEISEDMNLGLISIETLRYIQDMGFSISVDDFGAGVSKLSDVLSGELRTIKTDKSLLPSTESPDNKIKGFNTIIKAIKASGSSICVEGVETVSQMVLAQNAGCSLAQGYLFSKPIPKEQVIEFVKNFDYSNYE